MVIHDSTPVNNFPATAEENGGALENSKFSSPSTITISVPESLINENLAPAATPRTVDNGLTKVKSWWSFTSSSSKRSFGSSKDETFFDSHQWLQFDSEDDFYSVNGDFTASLGNTPQCSFSEKLPRFHNPLFEEEKPRVTFSHSPAPRRKKLAELFRDSIREERVEILEESWENQSEKSKQSSSGNSGELKVIEDSVKEKKSHKSLNYHHRCLPRFSAFKGSLMEKRKRNKKKIHVK